MKTKRRWHFCLIDLSCWMEMWLFGMPLRFYWHPTDKHWDIPLLSRIAKRRSDRMWANSTPVRTKRPTYTCDDCGSTNVTRSTESEPSDRGRPPRVAEQPASPDAST